MHCSLGQCMALDGYIGDGDELGKVDFLPVCGQRQVLNKSSEKRVHSESDHVFLLRVK